MPVPSLVAALRELAGDPTSTTTLSDALGAMARWLDLAGLRLQLTGAEPLPGVVAGWGSLAQADGGTARDLAEAGGPGIGRLWADGHEAATELAASGVITAVQAARAHLNAERARQHLAALDAALQGIAAVQSVDTVLQLIVDRSRELVGAQYAALGIVDAQGVIEAFLTSGIDAETRRRIGPLPRGHGLLGLIVRENASFRIRDIEMDPRKHGFPPHHPEMHSFLGVPITASGKSVGNLYLTNKIGQLEFSADDQELVERFALHAGIAIDNAHLHRRLQQMVILEERDRIGRDLHDTVIQRIYGVSLALDDVPDMLEADPEEASARVDAAIESLNSTIREIREFIFILRPPGDGPSSLTGSLRALADEVRMNTGLPVEVTLPGADLPWIEGPRARELLAIAREALTNAARHAAPGAVSVQLSARDGEVALQVIDDGAGFDTAAAERPGHHGLRNMRQRAESLGGSIEIESAPTRGTRIIVAIPTRIGAVEDR
jgi:signal transduction histidine kinase